MAMKVVLVLFERLSGDQKHGFGFTSYRLAAALQDAGMLGGLICLEKDEGLDIPPERIHTFSDHRLFQFAMYAVNRIPRLIPSFNARAAGETLFERFACQRLSRHAGDILFLSRPLFPKAVSQAQKMGMRVWVQASIPHPLVNFELVRDEELRLGLPCRGPYSDKKRADRLAETVAATDKLVSMDPQIGKYAYESYARFLGPERIIALKHFFTVDPSYFESLAMARTEKGVGSEGVTFLHVSHMNLIKGIPYLLDAWRKFKQVGDREQCRLVLAGRRDENLDEVIRRDYSDLPGLELAGFVPDLLECLGDADVFVSPSVSDNGPGTIAEAMAAGMPVVSSLNCGFASLISDGENGFTYDFSDIDRLAEILGWFAENPSAIFGMGRRARGKVESFSVDRYADEIVGIVASGGE